MPEVWAGRLGEMQIASTSGGTALTTTAGYIEFPALTKAGDSRQCHVTVTPRNFATAVVAKVTFNPWLTVLKTTDSMAAPPTDYSIYAQDSSTGTSVDLSSLDTVANGDWVLVGSHNRFRGAYCDVDSTNSTASVTLTVEYWNGDAWVSANATNGTSSATAFDQDGLVYWTVPGAWVAAKFTDIYPVVSGLPANQYYSNEKMYWTRWSVNVALDSSVTLDSMVAANRSATYVELLSGQPLEMKTLYGFGGLGCVEALVNAGTGNLVVNVMLNQGSEF